MKTVILCGGYGTRLSDQTVSKPKPMVSIGNRPILWHIMKLYAHFGHKDYILALGYLKEVIKEYFIHYYQMTSDLTVNLSNGLVETSSTDKLDWTVQMVDTGLDTDTGGRIRRIAPYIGNQTFMVTYGDGVTDLPIDKLLAFHRSHGKLATVTAVRPPARFGNLSLKDDQVIEFREKPQAAEGWINGGFFIFEPQVIDYIEADHTVLEREPLENLARDGQLMAYRHSGFWHCMDTKRDLKILENLWEIQTCPWRLWND